MKFTYDEFGEYTQFLTEEFNRSDLSGMSYNFGINYKTFITDKFELVLGATYAPEVSLNSDNIRTFSTVTYNPFTETTVSVDTEEVNLESRGLAESSVNLPSKYSLVQELVSLEYGLGAIYLVNTNEFNNPLLNIGNSKFVNAETWSIGDLLFQTIIRFQNIGKELFTGLDSDIQMLG